ncbi:MAG: zinc-dependent alcohol dehydrogenase family protein [Candidatus Palauibacterales bacterium]|nr:zinc-dependent alcohol dehydrogenase family protein [Candidatus Palauibacterales bacterium]MDP2528725.1 zinc-dependent alcohol dehydrogenase family protein [Candidatus Palauibacterales bacterium]MDP2585229.1 zinc-dependent alcohol dehydrogenase family protein [Candidatus Palauibacterales bacterium]
MKAMVLGRIAPIEERPLELRDIPDPVPGRGEIRVRVLACGVCRTDLHVIEGDLPAPDLPRVPGHQVVGVVEASGPDCSRFEPGDRVGIAWLRETCGTCEFCRAGQENLCESSRYTGYHADGGFAELAVVREDFAYRIPDAFGDVQATPLLCAGIIGYRSLRRARLPDGGRLGLFGFGSSAHIVIQVARHRGGEVYVATRGESHRALARDLGAVWTGGAYDPIPTPLHSAIVFAPAGEIVPIALRSLRKGGTVSLAGIHMSPIPEMEYEPCLFHEKTLQSVEANTREDGRELLREAAEIPVRASTTVFPLEEANEALARLKHDGIDGTAVLRVAGA